MVRITALAIGSRGDVQPFVALGAGLRAAGHEVRVATHERLASIVLSHGLAVAPLAEGDLSRGGATAKGRRWRQRRSRLLPVWVGVLEDASSVARRRLADAFAACEDADAVIASPLTTLLALQVSEATGIRMLRAYYGPLGWAGRPMARALVWQCMRPWVNRARRQALGLAPMGRNEPLTGLDRSGVPVLYAYSLAVAPPPADALHAYVTGYWLLEHDPSWRPPAALTTFLADGPPAVAVSFGEWPSYDPRRRTALVVEALGRAGRRGIVIGSPDRWPDELLPDTVFRSDPVPFSWLFEHVAAAVHHGGAGTTADALRAGAPAAVVPGFADQAFWASRVHAIGAGPAPIPQRRLTVQRLAAAIAAAAGDREMRARTERIARMLRAEDGIGQAVRQIERALGCRAVTERNVGSSSSPLPSERTSR